MVVFVVKRYAVREAKKWRYAVRNAKTERYAVRKGGGGCHPQRWLSTTVCDTNKHNSHTEVCQKELARISLQKRHCQCCVYLDTLLKKLTKVAEIAYTPSIPIIDRKISPPKHNTWKSK